MGYLDQTARTSVSRRGFVKAGAAAAAATALSGALAACSPQSENAVELSETGASTGADPEEGAQWIPVACWHGCASRMCVNKALVKDGVVLRQKTDDNYEDSVERSQHRGCLRGRSQRKHVFGADRLKYPMKRKHWEPLTGGDKSLRGKDEWERITWDEALDYVAAEIRNVIHCRNPRCITSIEQGLEHIFTLTDEENQIYRCKYCEEKYTGHLARK